MVLHFLLLILVFNCGINSALAQSKDSLKIFKEQCANCDEYVQKNKLDKAIDCLKETHAKFPSQLKPLLRLCDIYYKKGDFANAILFANKAIDLNANEAFQPLSSLANLMNSNKDDHLAIKIMNRLSVSEIDTQKLKAVENNRLRYTLINQVNSSPIPGVVLKNMGDSINTKENEYLPSISLDGNKMVFTRNVGGNEDFYISKRDSFKSWSKAQNMGYPPNTGMPDGAAKLSADGYYLFYTRCDMRSPNGYTGGGCDIVFSYQEDSAWSSPQYFGLTINTPGYEGQPCLSSDNKDMYFVSDREGGYGGKDIWVSHFINNFWSAPENLGPNVNTSKDETSPFIHPDNVSLYFSSNGHIGLGSNDLFLSRRNNDGSWKKPINLGAPINTKDFDGSLVVNAKGTKGYCASDRGDTKGGLDIYSFDLYAAIQPIPTLCLKGFVYDKFYKNKIYSAKMDFFYTYTNAEVGSVESNKGDASYAKALQLGKTYLIRISENGYRPFYKLLKLKTDTLADNIYFNFKLKQPGLVDTLYRNVLQVDSSKVRFDSTSKIVLDTILSKWQNWNEDSATVKIFLKGYYYSGDTITDSTFKMRLDQCENQLRLATEFFQHKGIKCQYLMTDLDMIVLKDDEELFDKIDVLVIEDY